MKTDEGCMDRLMTYMSIKILLTVVVVIILYVCISYFFTNTESYANKNNINNNLDSSNFDSSDTVATKLGDIFKDSQFNFNAYPNVEIKPGKQLFQDNKVLPECCFYYSDYSTDRGCPCITPDQQYYLQRRGINRHDSSFKKDTGNFKNVFFSPSMALQGEQDPFKKNNVYFKRDNPSLSDDVSANIHSKLHIGGR